MKNIILLSILLVPVAHAKAGEVNFLCSYRNLKPAQAWLAEQNNSFDKFQHCAVSCYLARRCSTMEVRAVGVLKEFRDFLGYGNPEMADIEADFFGVNLAEKKIARHDEDCSRICDENFRP